MPPDWRAPLAFLAAVFGWSPSDLMHLKLREIPFWVAQAKRYGGGRQG